MVINVQFLFLYLFSFCICVIFAADISGKQNSENFGPYEYAMANYTSCKGPKAKDAATTTVRFDKIGDAYMGQMNMSFPEPTPMDEIRLTMIPENGASNSTSWGYRLKKPCEHFLASMGINAFLKHKNCVIQKGFYSFVVDYTQYHQIFFGKSFFYGVYVLKVLIVSRKGNIMCLVLHDKFIKK